MILAIVQARMASTRLPGKVIKKIKGKPLIWYLLKRLKACEGIDKIIVATSLQKENDEICEYVKSIGFDAYSGSEEDVLGRFYHAALKYKPKVIVRITADCPLIDPIICDELIGAYLKERVDYACLSSNFAEGLDCEVFSFKALEIAHKKAKLGSEREHVSPYITNNSKLFKIFTLENESDDSKYRFTVDEPEDFEAVKTIIEALYAEDSLSFTFRDIKKFLSNHPEIAKKNIHIIRNQGYLKSVEKERI